MDDPTAIRAGLNEAAFRRVNEDIRATTTVADVTQRFGFVCECAVIGCNEVVELTLPDYEQIRQDPRRFLIAEGHEIPDVEEVVERHDGHAVVEKVDEASVVVAEANDPRGGR